MTERESEGGSITFETEYHVLKQPDPMCLTVTLIDWANLRKQAMEVREPIHWIKNLGWALVTVSASAGLALVPWLPAYQQLPSSAQLRFDYVTPLLACVCGGCALAAVFSYFANKAVASSASRPKVILLECIDLIQQRAGVTPASVQTDAEKRQIRGGRLGGLTPWPWVGRQPPSLPVSRDDEPEQ
jgi:hypothetical protein